MRRLGCRRGAPSPPRGFAAAAVDVHAGHRIVKRELQTAIQLSVNKPGEELQAEPRGISGMASALSR